MRTRWIIAAVLVVIGAALDRPGAGLMPGSGFMDGDVRWAVIGAVLVVVGVVIGWTAFRARSRA